MMSDNVIKFPTRDDSGAGNRFIAIEFGSAAIKVLEERIATENLNDSTIVNRAVHMYDVVRTLMSHLDRYDKVSGVMIGPDGTEVLLTVQRPN
jgi:hypothetical protein